MKNKAVCISLPESLIKLLDEVMVKRQDPTRSDTIRVLLLSALAEMSFLPDETKKALGFPEQEPEPSFKKRRREK
jgi:metal-responsive CopG/Arc/MetJ family transcriptional regulator